MAYNAWFEALPKAEPLPGFAAWMKKVDAIIAAKYGITSEDLIDQTYADWFEDGMTAAKAAARAIRNQTKGEVN